jgi:hypothetical protein
MAQHRADDGSYVPVKTVTLLVWLFGLIAALCFGLTVGDKFSVYSHPLFGAFPTAPIAGLEKLVGGFPAEDIPEQTVAALPAVTEEPTVISPAAATSRSTATATRTSQPVRTPSAAPTSDIPVAVAPSPVVPSTAVPTPAPVISEPVPKTPTPVVETPIVETPAPVTEEPVVEDPAPTDIPEATATPTEEVQASDD